MYSEFSTETIIASKIVDWAKKEGYIYVTGLWFKGDKVFNAEDLFNEFKKHLGI